MNNDSIISLITKAFSKECYADDFYLVKTCLCMPEIHIAAAIIINSEKKMLLVRKKNTQRFMQAGGKIEAGESPLDALLRELDEELQIQPNPTQIHYHGEFHAPAANEPGHTVHAHIYQLTWHNPIHIAAELEEARWEYPSDATQLLLAPLTEHFILPLLI